MTTASPERSSSLTEPSFTNQESAPKHAPYVEAPPGRPPIERHGQMASQLHDSKYEPRTPQSPRSIIAASCRAAEAGSHNPVPPSGWSPRCRQWITAHPVSTTAPTTSPPRSPYGFRSSPAYWGLGWHLIYPSWRDGFRHGLGDTPPSANPAE